MKGDERKHYNVTVSSWNLLSKIEVTSEFAKTEERYQACLYRQPFDLILNILTLSLEFFIEVDFNLDI